MNEWIPPMNDSLRFFLLPIYCSLPIPLPPRPFIGSDSGVVICLLLRGDRLKEGDSSFIRDKPRREH